MLTVFTIPKSFKGHVGTIQRNAIRSWLALRPKCKVILFGDDEGVAEVAAEFGIRHIPEIEKTELGTPLLSSAFEIAKKEAKSKILVYTNSDIILLNDFTEAIQKIKKSLFLMSGQRWNINLKEEINFDKSDWEKKLRECINDYSELHGPLGMDYCVFPRNLPDTLQMPGFAVGRAGWDNWVIYRVRSLGIPVIDATEVTTVIHQNHDYSHSPYGRKEKVTGPEVQRTLKLAGGFVNMLTLRDADWVLTSEGVRKPPFPRRVFSMISLFYPWRLSLAFKRKIQSKL